MTADSYEKLISRIENLEEEVRHLKIKSGTYQFPAISPSDSFPFVIPIEQALVM